MIMYENFIWVLDLSVSKDGSNLNLKFCFLFTYIIYFIYLIVFYYSYYFWFLFFPILLDHHKDISVSNINIISPLPTHFTLHLKITSGLSILL